MLHVLLRYCFCNRYGLCYFVVRLSYVALPASELKTAKKSPPGKLTWQSCFPHHIPYLCWLLFHYIIGDETDISFLLLCC